MTPLTLCSNTRCNIRLTCERANRQPDESQEWEEFNCGQVDGTTCDSFILRDKLDASRDPDLVHRESRRRGRRHNAHAPRRESYTGSEDLFGISLTGKGKPAKREKLHLPEHLRKRPDLMVKRHIRDGRDVNKENEE